MKSIRGVLSIVAAAIVAASAASDAFAGIVAVGDGTSAGGHAISAEADISFLGNTMTVTLKNTTFETFGPAELLAGFDFALNGVSVVGPLTYASTPHARTVTGTGVGQYTDTGAVNMLTADGGSPTWQIETNGAMFRLIFHPDAKYGIIGNPVNGAYANADGGIVNNSGHTPFAAYEATFTFGLSGVATDSSFKTGDFLFNTSNFTDVTVVHDDVVPVPLPSAAWAGLALLAGLGLFHARKRRRTNAGL